MAGNCLAGRSIRMVKTDETVNFPFNCQRKSIFLPFIPSTFLPFLLFFFFFGKKDLLITLLLNDISEKEGEKQLPYRICLISWISSSSKPCGTVAEVLGQHSIP